MKTSLATLAATSSAHSSTTGLMTVNSASSSSNANTAAANTSAADINDSNYELRTEFYTREGLWKLVQNGDYVKHHQPPAAQTPATPSYPSSTGGITSVGTTASGVGTSSSSQSSSSSNANDLVKVATFRFLKSYTLSLTNNSLVLHSERASSKQQTTTTTYLCENCYARSSSSSSNNNDKNADPASQVRFRVNDGYDDDDDVVYNSEERLNENSDSGDEDEAAACRVCKCRGVNLINECGISGSGQSTQSAAAVCLDLVCFNFAREIYFYEFSPIRENLKTDAKNLIHKKPYRTFMSTCFDINETASVANSLLDLQTSTSMAAGASVGQGGQTKTLSLSESNLSLIVAAGFNKGEIHVFDCYKKEASVFYNNSKLVDKSKVTCIRWLPNSMNLFVVGYSSGSIYLYDANNQAQASLAPVFTKLVQNEAFSVFVNGSTSSPTLGTAAASNAAPGATNTANTIQTHQSHSKTAPSVVSQTATTSTSQSSGVQKKLVLLSANQTTTQTAKNPLLKLTVGTSSVFNSSSVNSEAASSFPFFTDGMCSGANGVNELAFSPCGDYLAVVSQDGYLRVFTFIYKSNLQMQIELRCSMKSYFGGLLCVCWSPDSKYLVTGGEDDLITVFSFVEMRVACRGRGHSSWVNSCAFDPWTSMLNPATSSNSAYDDNDQQQQQRAKSKSKSSSGKQTVNSVSSKSSSSKAAGSRRSNEQQYYTHSDKEQDADSDLEDYHNQKLKNLHIGGGGGASSSPPCSSGAARSRQVVGKPTAAASQRKSAKNPVFYRFASCGQDNQICFWDLTEDVLREKQSSLTSRSRGGSTLSPAQQPSSSSQLPQIIIQPSTLNSYNDPTARPHHQSSSSGSSSTTTTSSTLDKHHTATQSLVSTAKHLFSLKHSESKANKMAAGGAEVNGGGEEHPVVAKSATGFFKMRHKRNSSLNNTANGEKGAKSSSSSGSKVTLNSYRKSPNNNAAPINTITDSSSNTAHHHAATLDSAGINSLHVTSRSKTPPAPSSNNSSNNANYYSPFNLCPKLHEVPMIEPLICKRIASERLTSIVFREDCFLVSSQDGIVQTWARPNRFSDSTSDTDLPNLSSSNFNKINSTSL